MLHAILLTCLVSVGQKEPPLTFTAKVVAEDGKTEAKLRRGQIAKVIIEGQPNPGFHTYPLTQRTKLQSKSEIWKYKVAESGNFAPLWPVIETQPDLVSAENFTQMQHLKKFTWTQELLVLPDAKPGPAQFAVKLQGQVCDENVCVPVKQELTANFVISDEPTVEISADVDFRSKEVQPDPVVVVIKGEEGTKEGPKAIPDHTPDASPKSAAAAPHKGGITSYLTGTHEEYQKTMDDIAKRFIRKDVTLQDGGNDLWSFVLAGIFWGAVSLITPCVFPMIPITVSFFLKQSEKQHHKPVTMALVYSATIVVVLTLAAAFLLTAFRWLSVNPIMNYFLGGLFVFFALSLFGMYEIELPSGLARFTSSREGQGGLMGTMFMALTFTIISFACVAPFLGGFGGTSGGSARPWWHNILGGLAFSTTFAAPFFFLALFPTLLRKMPKSGSWLNTVKVVMGFLELAAAIKFFRAAEIVMTNSKPWLFTFDLSLGAYIALCFICGLYLLGIFRLPHDTPEEHLTVPRLVFAVAFLSLGTYLLPAQFKVDHNGEPQRPSGAIYAWVDSFLLPEARPGKGEEVTANLSAALVQAKEQSKRIFLDFTGVNCTNCKINEKDVFSKPEIRDLLNKYISVQIYTDSIPVDFYAPELRATLGSRPVADAAEVNMLLENQVFNSIELPLYAIIEPLPDNRIQVLGVARGRITDVAGFAAFLSDPK